MTSRPIFCPLRTEPYQAIRAGKKRIEWRPYGPRWNREVVRRGRAITFSHGYSGERVAGTVTGVRRVEGVAGRVWRSGEPKAIHDYQNWSGKVVGWERIEAIVSRTRCDTSSSLLRDWRTTPTAGASASPSSRRARRPSRT